MGKISLLFTFVLLIYLIGKIVTDEKTVHQHMAYNDSDSLTSLASEVNRDTASTVTNINRGRETTTSANFNSDTVTTSTAVVNRDTMITDTTIAISVSRDTEPTSATDVNRETETTTGANRDTVTTSTTDVNRDTVTTSTTDVDRDTVTTPTLDIDRDTVTASTTGFNRDTVTSTTGVDRDTVTTPATIVDRDTVNTSSVNIDRDFLTTHAEDASNNDSLTTPSPGIDTDSVSLPETRAYSLNDAVTSPATATSITEEHSLNLLSKGDLSNCSDVVMVSCSQQCGVHRQLPCSCDQFCLIYKNCCPDYEMVCAHDAGILREYYSDLLDIDITCLESPALDLYIGLQVISGCPVQASEESKRLCNPANIKPVTLDNTNLHFINIHCLICNGFNPTHTTYWDLQIVPHTINLDLITGGFEKLIKSSEFSTYPLPQSGIDLTYCCNTIIDHCEASTITEDKCSSSHSFYLSYGAERGYCLKNHFCAECNKNSYPDVCKWHEMDFGSNKEFPYMAFLFQIGNTGMVSVKTYGTRNMMLWLRAECKLSSPNDEFGVDITDCTLQECRQNVQLTDGNCFLNNKIFCFKIFANLSLVDQDINLNALTVFLSNQAIAALSRMNITLGSFNTTFYERTRLLYYEWQFTNQTLGLKIRQFIDIYLPSLEMGLLKKGISGNISVCTVVSKKACSHTDVNGCRIYHNLELSPHHPTNLSTRKLISNYVLYICLVLIKFGT